MKTKSAQTVAKTKCGFCGHLAFLDMTTFVADLDHGGKEIAMCEACQEKFKVWQD